MENAELMYGIVKNKSAHYRTYQVPKKKGGFRTIEPPSKELKEIQRAILDTLLYNIEVHDGAHGAVRKRGIVTNASEHLQSACIVNIDLKDFFPSITKEIVFRELSRYLRSPHAVTELVTYNDRLPQGAPTSPCIANIVCIRLDRKLGALAREHDAIYTRYFDDITFSSKTNKDLQKIIPKAHSYIKKEGFDINYQKIEVMRRGGRQIVTGLVVNDKLNVPRDRVRKFRAQVDQTELDGSKDDFYEINKLKGFNSFIMGANRAKGIKYLEKINRLKA